MLLLVDATFLTYAGQIDLGMLEAVTVSTLAEAIEEAAHNLGDKIARDHMAQHVQIMTVRKKSEGPDFANLSGIDRMLLTTAVESKDRCILVTDDRLLRQAAGQNHVKVLQTPEFIELLVKSGKVDRSCGLTWLKALEELHNRRGLVEKVIKRLSKR